MREDKVEALLHVKLPVSSCSELYDGSELYIDGPEMVDIDLHVLCDIDNDENGRRRITKVHRVLGINTGDN